MDSVWSQLRRAWQEADENARHAQNARSALLEVVLAAQQGRDLNEVISRLPLQELLGSDLQSLKRGELPKTLEEMTAAAEALGPSFLARGLQVVCYENILRQTNYMQVSCVVAAKHEGSGTAVEICRKEKWSAAVEAAKAWLSSQETSESES